LLKSSI